MLKSRIWAPVCVMASVVGLAGAEEGGDGQVQETVQVAEPELTRIVGAHLGHRAPARQAGLARWAKALTFAPGRATPVMTSVTTPPIEVFPHAFLDGAPACQDRLPGRDREIGLGDGSGGHHDRLAGAAHAESSQTGVEERHDVFPGGDVFEPEPSVLVRLRHGRRPHDGHVGVGQGGARRAVEDEPHDGPGGPLRILGGERPALCRKEKCGQSREGREAEHHHHHRVRSPARGTASPATGWARRLDATMQYTAEGARM